MSWQTIRLELAPTPEFPSGSASRAYLIRLPLDGDCAVDAAALAANPARATVRRFWASEPDRFGRVVHTEDGWVLQFNGARGPHASARLRADRLHPGGRVTIVGPDGTPLPFRVADVRRLS